MFRRRLIQLIAFVALCMPATSAMADCKDILSGLLTFRTTLNDTTFEQEYINWLSSNEYSSRQSTSTASGSLGLKLPIEGVPIEFSSAFSRGEYGSQSYSKAFASYLKQHTVETHKFFQKVREANPDVVAAWSRCESERAHNAGMYCSISAGPNADEIIVYVQLVPFGGDTAERKITEVTTLPPGALVAEENVNQRFTTSGATLTFKRKTSQGGSIKIKTDNIRYDCGNAGELKFLPVVNEPTAPARPVASEGVLSVRFDTTCNCFQGRDTQILPAPSDTGYQNLSTTYHGRTCLKLDSGTLSNVVIQTERTRRHMGTLCGSEPERGIQTLQSACYNIDISINSEDGQCDYHWYISGTRAP